MVHRHPRRIDVFLARPARSVDRIGIDAGSIDSRSARRRRSSSQSDPTVHGQENGDGPRRRIVVGEWRSGGSIRGPRSGSMDLRRVLRVSLVVLFASTAAHFVFAANWKILDRSSPPSLAQTRPPPSRRPSSLCTSTTESRSTLRGSPRSRRIGKNLTSSKSSPSRQRSKLDSPIALQAAISSSKNEQRNWDNFSL